MRQMYCRAGQVTDDNTTGRMRTACWITNAIHTHTQNTY